MFHAECVLFIEQLAKLELSHALNFKTYLHRICGSFTKYSDLIEVSSSNLLDKHSINIYVIIKGSPY